MFERITKLFNRQPARNASARESWHDILESYSSLPGIDSLMADDHGWSIYGDNALDGDIQQSIRNLNVRRARICWHRDPLAKQAVRLWTDYTLGSSGAKFKAEDKKADAILQKVWNSRQNQVIFGFQGQRKSSVRLLVDGEVFFVLFGSGEETIIRRIPDPLQVTRILFDPEDGERPLFYRRDYAVAGKVTTTYYRALAVSPEEDDIPDVIDDGRVINGLVDGDVCLLHMAFDPFANRGNGLLSTVVDWSNEHWEFMSSRVSIVKALADFAWKIKGKGGAAQMEALRRSAELRTPYNADSTTRKSGSTWIENQSVELSAMPRDTGAASAKGDGDLLKLMVCAGTGIMQHYFGDPSTGNLAIGSAMELPMLKQFEAYQQLWAGTYKEMFRHIVGNTDDTLSVDIDFPPIVTRDSNAFADSVAKFEGVIPGLVESRSVLMQVLMSLGVNNVEEEVENILKRSEEKKAAATKQAEDAAKKAAEALKSQRDGQQQDDKSEDDPEQEPPNTSGDKPDAEPSEGIDGAVDGVLLALAELREQL